MFNYDGLVQGGVVERGELPYAGDALDELVAAGILERVFGRSYALKGRGPSGRLYP